MERACEAHLKASRGGAVSESACYTARCGGTVEKKTEEQIYGLHIMWQKELALCLDMTDEENLTFFLALLL